MMLPVSILGVGSLTAPSEPVSVVPVLTTHHIFPTITHVVYSIVPVCVAHVDPTPVLVFVIPVFVIAPLHSTTSHPVALFIVQDWVFQLPALTIGQFSSRVVIRSTISSF